MKPLCLTFLIVLLLNSASGQDSPVVVDNTTNNPVPVTLTDIGDVDTAQEWFLCGLEWGSGMAALLFGFMTVRRALSLGDAWND
jgi:hypothetical protein